MKKKLFALFLSLAGFFVPPFVLAEDIDLFAGATPTVSELPNVLLIVDNTANWNTAFSNEMTALRDVFQGLDADKFRVGVMMFTETGAGNGGSDGAYVRAAIRTMSSTNKTLYADMITSLDITADKSNGGKAAKAMMEAYFYFKGGAVQAGNDKNKTDFTSNVSGTTQSRAIYALSGNALSSRNATTYNSPIPTADCKGKNYIIYISNGAAQDNTADLTLTTTKLAAEGGSTTMIALNPSGSQENTADEWARFMRYGSSLGITTYTLDVNKVTTGQGPGWTALMKSMATQSGGRYFDVASTGSNIKNALNDVFSEIQSVNSVFASVSLPVTSNTQGTFLNQVFVGMFRPDQDSKPRWHGNLKQYKLGESGSDLRLEDADSKSAVNPLSGFVTECARSFWTPTVVDTEFASNPQGECLTVANSKPSNYPDGNVVEKGAQAYRLRSSATARVVKTCSATMASCTTLTTFDNTNVSQAQLGAADTTERDNLINWLIGADNKDDEDGDGSSTDRRISIHGDVVHSRPVAINYGGATVATSNVVVFYGANDGMLRAVNGNRTASIGTIPAGGELWSFMPPEFYGSIKRLRDNSPRISYPGSLSGTPTPIAKNYGLDGPITAFSGNMGGTDKKVIYATMRRGGRAIYAFDVTSLATDPTNPTLMWKRGCPNRTNDTDCTSGMDGIGQTWSSVKSFTTAGYGGTPANSPLIIFGGGYDTCEDYDGGGANHNCTSSSKGGKIYVLDASTGALVKTFDTGANRGVVADVTLVRRADGHVIYGYTADLGGNVYRLTFGTGPSSSWTITKIASLGCDTASSCASPRKFMFPPSVVSPDGTLTESSSYVIMLGSGDREKPLNSYTATAAVQNHFFMFTDKPGVVASTYPGSTDCGSNIICVPSLLQLTSSAPTAAQLAAKKGWYLPLQSTEQVVTSAITIFGVVTFSTHAPAVSSSVTCSSNLGTARVYNINYDTATGANADNSMYSRLAGDGLPPSPVGGQVLLDNGTTLPFCIGCSPESPLQAKRKDPGALGSQPKGRLYWFMQK